MENAEVGGRNSGFTQNRQCSNRAAGMQNVTIRLGDRPPRSWLAVES